MNDDPWSGHPEGSEAASAGSSMVLNRIVDAMDSRSLDLPANLADALVSGLLFPYPGGETGAAEAPLAAEESARPAGDEAVSPDPFVRLRAAHDLGRGPADVTSAVRALARLLDDESWEVHSAALCSLLRIGPEAIADVLRSWNYHEIMKEALDAERFLIFLSAESWRRPCAVYAEPHETGGGEGPGALTAYIFGIDIPGSLACIALCIARMGFNIDKSLTFRIEREIGETTAARWRDISVTSCRISRRGARQPIASFVHDLQEQLERGHASLVQNQFKFLRALKAATRPAPARGPNARGTHGARERMPQDHSPPNDDKDTPILLRGARAFHSRLPDLLKDKRNHGRLVAFHGEAVVGIAPTLRKLYAICRNEKKPLNEVFVECVSQQFLETPLAEMN
jgi:hypothetical protein